MNASWPRGPLPAVAGGIVGGVVGYLAFFGLTRVGLYALVLPGALLGLGCGLGLARPSKIAAAVCGVVGLALGILTEWQFAPFVEDDGLAFFVASVFELSTATKIMLALGAVLAAWFGRGRATN